MTKTKQHRSRKTNRFTRNQSNQKPLQPDKDGRVLRFTPTAWAKLQFLCHAGETEIGGFGVTNAEDLLFVESFETVKQIACPASVEFDDEAVAEFFDNQVDAGRRPEQFARIWCHTHPGDCPHPSSVDEETFARVFGRCDWAVMFILARGGATYARLRFNVGPGGNLLIPVQVDYGQPFAGTDFAVWQEEYEDNVRPLVFTEQVRDADAQWQIFQDELVDNGTLLLDDERAIFAEQDCLS